MTQYQDEISANLERADTNLQVARELPFHCIVDYFYRDEVIYQNLACKVLPG